MIHPIKVTASDLPTLNQMQPRLQPLTHTDVVFTAKNLRSMRLQLQDPQTFEVTAIYITRTDKSRFRVKVFRSKKCLIAKYIEAESFADLLNNISVSIFNL